MKSIAAAVVGVSDFTAVLIGAIVSGVLAIAAGVIAARVQAKRTEELALRLRRREREERALWELERRVSELLARLGNPNEIVLFGIDDTFVTGLDFRETRELLGELNARWRQDLGATVRSGPLVRLYVEVQKTSDLLSDQQAEAPKPLIDALEGLLEKTRHQLEQGAS